MTNCKEFAALLDLYVDGELRPEEMVRVRDHLDDCPACRAYVDDALAIRAAFPSAEDTQVPDSFTEGVMAAVRQCGAPAKPVRRTPWKKMLLPLAACFAVAVMALPLRTLFTGGAKMESAATAAMDTAETESAFEEPAAAPAPAADAPSASEASSEEEFKSCKTVNGSAPQDGQAPMMATAPAAGSPQPFSLESLADAGDTASRLTLTAEEAGEALADFTPVEETETELRYALTPEELDTLLAALSQSGIAPAEEPRPAESEDGTILVIVLK